MVSPRAWGVVDPVKNDKRQAANHEDDSHDQEDGCPNLLWGAQRQRLYQAQVKGSGQDEDEHCCRRGADEAKDVPDGGDKDDQHVVKGQDEGGNEQVASPAELSPAEE